MRKLIAWILSACLILCLASCGKEAAAGLEQLKAEDGSYIYPGLSWGMTIDEAAEATGWEIPEPQKLYNESGELVDSVSTVQEVSFGGQSWIAQLQFDPEGALWSMTLAQTGSADELEKQFKSYDASLTKAFGAPSQAAYDQNIETAGGALLDSTVTWENLDSAGERLSGMALSCRHMEQNDKGSLALAMNCKK